MWTVLTRFKTKLSNCGFVFAARYNKHTKWPMLKQINEMPPPKSHVPDDVRIPSADELLSESPQDVMLAVLSPELS